MSNNTQPEIRFPGFTEDWEERKLNEGMTEYTDRVYIQDDEIYKQVSVKNVGEITLRGEQIGSKIGRKRQAKVNLIEHPDTLIFTRQTIEQGGIGFAPKETDGAIVTENMPTIDVDNDIINCNYLLAYVKTEDWYRKVILKNIEGGTAQIAIHEDSILSSEVLIPKIEEQQKIGTFFKQLDDTIALQQRKLDLLKETKKGFLQKMFPKNGAKVPEIRFPGFTEDWEQRKLGELATIVRGASPRPIQDPKWFDTESDVGWLRIADVTEQDGRIYYLEQHISKLGQEKTRVLVEPHLLLSIAATVGKPVVNYVKTGVHDGFLIFLNAIFDREFMFQWLEMFRPKWQKYGQPGSQVNLNSELVRNQEILIPNNEEQQKIGSFFKQLDDTIALHQRELDVLKETKKGFLQKMFV
ncbi:restriction endonuclease subunit S [Enterococcus faecium]|uniref:restriction endonuclease subunit S n=1 Tax=Enterococcus faecium TaxID=1352 RepID=UPI0032E8C881